jgi:hypothetical protein
MSEPIFMEYVGFISAAQGREYAFHVRFSSQDSRDYTVTIATDVFASRRVSYQDGPNLCSSKLKRELTANPDVPTGTSFVIDQKEIADHNARQTAEAPKRPYGLKPPNS